METIGRDHDRSVMAHCKEIWYTWKLLLCCVVSLFYLIYRNISGSSRKRKEMQIVCRCCNCSRHNFGFSTWHTSASEKITLQNAMNCCAVSMYSSEGRGSIKSGAFLIMSMIKFVFSMKKRREFVMR